MRGSTSTREQLPEQRHKRNAISSVNDDESMPTWDYDEERDR